MYMQNFIPKNLLKRAVYIQKAKPFIDQDLIKVFSGQRRVGKSYMLFQIMEHIRSGKKDVQIEYLSFELAGFSFIKNDTDLLTYLKEKEQDKKGYLFIDEVQEIENFDKALRFLWAEKKWDVWCTGSNAALLSGDIAGKLSGRVIEFRVNSLSYPEFLVFHKLKNNAENLEKYLRFGGLPYLINLPLEPSVITEYHKGIYATILYKDIISRNRIRNTAFLENLIHFLAEHTGSLFSAKRISDYLKSQKINISPVLVIEYLDHLCNAFFVQRVKRSEIQGRKIFEFGEKFYFEDLGLRNLIVGYKQKDINKILENTVFLHLKYLDYHISVGVESDKEIDFIAEKNNERVYFQVAFKISDEQVYQREYGNLHAIKDNYPKYVITMDDSAFDSDNGIRHLSLSDFLMMEDF